MNTKNERFFNAKNLATLGLLIGIILVIDITHLGYFTFGVISVTSLHIPVIIGACIGGWRYGGILGLAFGLTSFFRALQGGEGLMTPFFMNPLLSILPRLLFGLFVGFLVDRLKGKNPFFHYALPAFLGTMVHTTMVMGGIYLGYGQRLAEMIGGNMDAVRAMVLGVFATNGLPEAVFAAILSLAVMGAYEVKTGKANTTKPSTISH